jgi:hypothetical protein
VLGLVLGLEVEQPASLEEPGRDGRVAHPHGLPCRHEIAVTTFAPSLIDPRAVSDGWASAQPPHTSVGLSLADHLPSCGLPTLGRLTCARNVFVRAVHGGRDWVRAGDDLFDVQTRQTVPPGTPSQLAHVGDGQGPCAHCRRRTRSLALHRRLPVIGPAARPAVRTARMTYSRCSLGFTSADCTHGVVSANMSRAAGKYGGSGQLLMECVAPGQDGHQGRGSGLCPGAVARVWTSRSQAGGEQTS